MGNNNKRLQQLLQSLPQALAHAVRALASILVSKPVQGGLVVVNIVLVKSALRALQRARFASTVRVVKDLRTESDLKYLLGSLPPWVANPEWERGDAVQVLLGLLWPAINSTVCSLLKRELEERVQENSDFGHIAFSRLSFGKHAPAIVGIKAVPLHGEDLLAMVLDVDVRWAGEPDVVLHLTKLGGASLGLSNVQLSGVVRLVFSPITEDPPFLSRMTISLLSRPYVDFSIAALGGPDLMSLPAISSWLHGVVLNLADRAIVWPKEVVVQWGPRPISEEASAAEATVDAPLGILVVRVGPARIEQRRSTFLGRLKMPNPRLALIMPQGDGGVTQAGQTPVAEKTLSPTWSQQFVFVVSRRDQNLRLLLSHKRMELLGADMPLGAAEVPMEELLAEVSRPPPQSTAYSTSTSTSTPMPETQLQTPRRPGGGGLGLGMQTPPGLTLDSRTLSIERGRSLMVPSPYASPFGGGGGGGGGAASTSGSGNASRRRTPSPDVHGGAALHGDGYISASSSPRGRSSSPAHSVAWASPAASLAISDNGISASSIARALSSGAGGGGGGRASSLGPSSRRALVAAVRSPSQGLGLVIGAETERRSLASARVISMPREPTEASFDNHVHWAPPPPPLVREPQHPSAATGAAARPWLAPEGIWVQVPSSGAVTMAGMVSQAMESRQSSVGTPFAAMPDENRSWFSSIQSLVLGGGGEDDEVGTDDEDGTAGAVGGTAGEVQLVLRWHPCDQSPAPSPSASSAKGRHQQQKQKQKEEEQAAVAAAAAAAAEENGGGGKKGRKASRKQKKDQQPVEIEVMGSGEDSSATCSSTVGSSSAAFSNAPPGGTSAAASKDEQKQTSSPSAIPRSPVSASAPATSPTSQQSSPAGVLVIRVAYTKMDYGDSPNNPILALSLAPTPAASGSSVATAAAVARLPSHRLITMECESGGRPGLLHWGRVFHLPVWDASSVRACLELGDAASSFKLSSYGTELYTLDACVAFDAAVSVEARAWIPLKDVVARGVVRGSWRLREARVAGGVGGAVADSERLDVGRVAMLMAWYPLETGASNGA